MRRRDFIKAIFVVVTAWPLAARAQAGCSTSHRFPDRVGKNDRPNLREGFRRASVRAVTLKVAT